MKFKIGQNNISYLGSNFKEWFGDMEFELDKNFSLLTSKKLERNMNDSEILDELKPQKVTLGDVYQTLKTLDKNEWALFYVEDKNGVLRAVRAHWYGVGWRVFAREVSLPPAWYAGFLVFSRNSSETLTSEPLELGRLETLEKRIEKLEQTLSKIKELL